MRLNSELLYEQIEHLKLPRLTLDLDGTMMQDAMREAMARVGALLGKSAAIG